MLSVKFEVINGHNTTNLRHRHHKASNREFIFISNIQNANDWKQYFEEEFKHITIYFFELNLPPENEIKPEDLNKQNLPTQLTAQTIYKIIQENNIPKHLPIIAHGVGGRVAVFLNVQKAIGSHLIIFGTRFFKRVFLREHIGNMLSKSKRTKWLAKIIYPISFDTKLISQLLLKLRHEDLTPLLPQIDVPTLLVWGDRDYISPLVNGIEAHKLIKNSLFRVITDATHDQPFKPVPQALKNLILDFINNKYAS